MARSGVSAMVGAAVAMMGLVLQGCNGDSDVSCSKADRVFFEHSIRSHLQRNPGANGVVDYSADGSATYDSHNNWWAVPFVSNGKKMLAILSCDGRVELSERL